MQQYGTDGTLGVAGSSPAGSARDVARTGTQQVKELGQTTRDRAFREIDGKRQTLASEVDKLAGVLENQRGQTEIAGPALDMAASGVRQLASALRDHTAEELLQGMTRNPVAVLAGTFALGFFATRLFKA